MTGVYQYRLKQTDYNGLYEYFYLNNEVEILRPDNFKLSQNYPNPFNPSTNIEFTLPADGSVRLDLYDITGREVKNLLEQLQRRLLQCEDQWRRPFRRNLFLQTNCWILYLC
ncbi:MAG: T9SS type A sorting domain-containing protein [Ignavibacteria bacterium]|nr:T9SS type A sorting domain-containing protein [Ignavibacteria bacterium]